MGNLTWASSIVDSLLLKHESDRRSGACPGSAVLLPPMWVLTTIGVLPWNCVEPIDEKVRPDGSAELSVIPGDFHAILFSIDRIVELESGQSLVAVKNLSLAEEYLADHFPGFPVMPGVLMLEALTQAGAWLIREHEDFAHSIVLLKQAKTIKYGSFVEPGRQLEL